MNGSAFTPALSQPIARHWVQWGGATVQLSFPTLWLLPYSMEALGPEQKHQVGSGGSAKEGGVQKGTRGIIAGRGEC